MCPATEPELVEAADIRGLRQCHDDDRKHHTQSDCGADAIERVFHEFVFSGRLQTGRQKNDFEE
jgi:hypothetical protein